MFEKHIYTEKFFDFIVQVTNLLDIYTLQDGEILSPNLNERTEKQKNLYKILIDMLT